MNTDTKKNYFLSQPHQPFFLLGIINAIFMMLIFALSYKGILSLTIDVKTFHVFSLVFFSLQMSLLAFYLLLFLVLIRVM